jgi:hypothetical protein
MYRAHAILVGVCTVVGTLLTGVAHADGKTFENYTLNAYGSTADGSVNVFANRDSSPLGSSGYAVFSSYNSSTYEFTQCVNSSFDITVTPSRSTLVFVTDGVGTNCPSGMEVVLTCDVTAESAVLHNVTTGTARIPAFDQKYTTHGNSDTYNNLTCQISANGLEVVALGGSASKSRQLTAP